MLTKIKALLERKKELNRYRRRQSRIRSYYRMAAKFEKKCQKANGMEGNFYYQKYCEYKSLADKMNLELTNAELAAARNRRK
jgi:hypothetical protein